MSCHTRGGVSGSTRGSTPNDDKAAATAFDTAPRTGMMPPSPGAARQNLRFQNDVCRQWHFERAKRPALRLA
jgi:hypothetical protein